MQNQENEGDEEEDDEEQAARVYQPGV